MPSASSECLCHVIHSSYLVPAVMQAVAKPSLRESAAHQAVLPDRVGTPPAPQGGALRWAPGPSFDEALESAKGPEKAAADLLPLDATFDPETHEGAGKLCYFVIAPNGHGHDP